MKNGKVASAVAVAVLLLAQIAMSGSASAGVDAAPGVVSTSPANGEVDVYPSTNITIVFSEPVSASASWFQISCTSGTHTAAVVVSDTTNYILNPDSSLGFSDVCTVTIYGANVADQDVADPPDTMVGNHSFSFTTYADTWPHIDGTIRAGKDPFIGAGIINTDQGQTEAVRVPRGRTAVFDISFRNTAVDPDNVLIEGRGDAKGFKVSYFRDGANITPLVKTQYFDILTLLAPGEAMSIVMKVKVGRAAKGRLLIRIQGFSMNDLVVSDGVLAKVRATSPR